MGILLSKKYSVERICESACSPIIVFALFWAIYAGLSMFFWYPEPYLYNDALFGGDLGRVSGDIYVIDGEHARVSTHPLFIILIQPIFHLFNGLVNDMYLSIFLFQSGTGALLVAVVSMILEEVHLRPALRIATILMFGLSGSQLIWSTAPETFMYGGLVIGLMWLFLIKMSGLNRPLSVSEVMILISFGVLLCGLTITNIIVFVLGLTYFFLRQKKQKLRVAVFLLICAAVMAVLVLLSLVQHFVWPLTPVFWSALSGSVSGQSGDLVLGFLSLDIDIARMPMWLNQTILFPWIMPDATLYEAANQPVGNEMIVFGDYDSPLGLVSGLLAALSMALILLKAISAIRRLGRKASNEIVKFDAAYLFMLSTWLIEVVFHYFFDSTEAFLFSAHFFFLFVVLTAMAFQDVEKRLPASVKWISCCILISILIVECAQNANVVCWITSALHSLTDSSVSVARSFATLALVGILAGLVGCLMRWLGKRLDLDKDVVAATSTLMGVYALIVFFSSAFIVLAF